MNKNPLVLRLGKLLPTVGLLTCWESLCRTSLVSESTQIRFKPWGRETIISFAPK